jgi:hypothetical protein
LKKLKYNIFEMIKVIISIFWFYAFIFFLFLFLLLLYIIVLSDQKHILFLFQFSLSQQHHAQHFYHSKYLSFLIPSMDYILFCLFSFLFIFLLPTSYSLFERFEAALDVMLCWYIDLIFIKEFSLYTIKAFYFISY